MSQTLLRSSTLKILLRNHRFALSRPAGLSEATSRLQVNNELIIKKSFSTNGQSTAFRRKQNMLAPFGGLSVSSFELTFVPGRFHQPRLIHSSAVWLKNDDSKKSDETDEAPGSSDPSDGDGSNAGGSNLPIPSLVALAPLQIPDFLPRVPVIAISRNPLFPLFIKMLEVG